MALIVNRPSAHTFSYRKLPSYPAMKSVFLKSHIIFFKKPRPLAVLTVTLISGFESQIDAKCSARTVPIDLAFDMIEGGVGFQFRLGHRATSVLQSPSVSADKLGYNILNYSEIPAFHIIPKSLLTFMHWLEATSFVVKCFRVLLKYDSKDTNL